MGIIRHKGINYTDVPDDMSDSNVTYESGDELNPSEPVEVSKLENKETLKSFAKKVSTMARNVRYLLKMLGTEDISAIGDGTTTGAIRSLKDGMTAVKGEMEDEYRTGNVNLTAENIGALSTAGGTVNGNISVDGFVSPNKGLYIISQSGVNGTDGYLSIARFVIRRPYVNNAIEVNISSRNIGTFLHVYISFYSSSATDPNLGKFVKYGNELRVFIKKIDTSTWDLVVPKSGANGRIDIITLNSYSISTGRITVTYPNELITDFVESEWTEAQFGGKIAEAVTAEQLNNLISTNSTDKSASDMNYIGYMLDEPALKPLYGYGDGARYKQFHSSPWIHEIYGDYRSGQIAVRSKNNGTWTSWRKVVDHLNFRNLIPEATTSASGLLGTADKNKLNSVNIYKGLTENFATQFRTQTNGSSATGNYFTTIRTNTANIDGLSQHGSGIAYGIHDTHGYLQTAYNDAILWTGGGNQDKLNWKSEVVLAANFRRLIPDATTSASGLMSAADKAKIGNLKTVATSGSFNDLSNKPTCPTALKNPAALTFTGAVTGSYDGSAAKSVAIPSVGNGTVTITQNGISKGSFTLNQAGNAAIALTDTNTTYGVATQAANGLMSAADKKKLDGVADNANNYTFPAWGEIGGLYELAIGASTNVNFLSGTREIMISVSSSVSNNRLSLATTTVFPVQLASTYLAVDDQNAVKLAVSFMSVTQFSIANQGIQKGYFKIYYRK